MGLKQRLATGEPIDGIVVRTPSHQVIEVLAARGVSLVMIDTEHSLIGPEALDAMLAVARALGVDSLVRVPAAEPVAIQQALDSGATGVVVPHVASGELAAQVVRWAHYGDGGRGYSGSTRSAGWGTRPMADVLTDAAAHTAVAVQVEDVAALDNLDAILAAPVDAVFIGAADLAVGLGCTTTDDPQVHKACTRIIEAATAADCAVITYAASNNDAKRWRADGVAVVLRGSDQTRLAP